MTDHVLAPSKMTQTMLEAAIEAGWPGSEIVYDDAFAGPEFQVDAIYKAAIAASPPLPEEVRAGIARIVDPKAWEFADRHGPNPIMKAEVAHEVRPSLAKADAILSLIGGAR